MISGSTQKRAGRHQFQEKSNAAQDLLPGTEAPVISETILRPSEQVIGQRAQPSMPWFLRSFSCRTQKLVSLLEAQPLFEHHRLFLENGLLESSDDGGEFAAAFQVPDQRWAEFVPVIQNPISEQHERGSVPPTVGATLAGRGAARRPSASPIKKLIRDILEI